MTLLDQIEKSLKLSLCCDASEGEVESAISTALQQPSHLDIVSTSFIARFQRSRWSVRSLVQSVSLPWLSFTKVAHALSSEMHRP